MANERPRPVTLLDVANEAGVSVSTASRALTGARRVRGDLEARVRGAVETLGYRPNEAARGLRMARTMTLGVLVHRLTSPVSLDLIDGMGAAAHEARYSLAVTSARGDRSLYTSLFQHMYGQRVDGLILVWPRGDLTAHLAPFASAGVPVVGIRWGTGGSGFTLVSADTSSGVSDAMAALAGMGHRLLTIIAHGVLWTPPDLRRHHIDRVSEAVGLRIRRRDSRESGTFHLPLRDLVASELASDDPPTAFLVPYDEVGEVLNAIRALGKRVPEDISVVSFTDSRFGGRSESARPATIAVNSFELGRLMVTTLLEEIENGPTEQDIRVPNLARWVPGSTAGPPPAR